MLTERGKRMPIDPEPYRGEDPRGLFVLRESHDGQVAVAATPDAFPHELHYRSHFSTCPNAAQHRR